MIFQKHNIRKRSKYNSKIKIVDGITFQSIKEANYYSALKMRVKAGDIEMFLMQIPFQLPGNVKYRCDFQEFWKDGTVHFIDVKGMLTKDFIMKKKMVEDLYPVEIEIVK